MANGCRRSWILVTLGLGSFPLSLSSIHLHSEARLLQIFNALSHFGAPLGTIECIGLPGIDVSIAFLHLDAPR